MIEKFLDLARELKKLWNVKVIVVLFVIGALGTVTENLEKDWRNWNNQIYSDHSIVKLI